MNAIRLFAASALVIIAGCGRKTPPAPPPSWSATQPSPLTRPVLPPLSKPSYHLSETTEQILPGYPVFASVSQKATFRNLRPTIDEAMKELMAASNAGGVTIAGPAVFVYHGATMELDKPFILEVGFPAAPGAKAAGKIKVAELPPMVALGLTYTGPLSAIDKAYDELMPKVQGRKLTPTGESREVYQGWEGPESPNNQVLIGIGVK